jgi:hypothetical protein
MKNIRNWHALWIILALLISACGGCGIQSEVPGESLSDEEAARRALISFFDHLHKGEYAAAADLYVGPTQHMIDHNPTLDPTDHVALWEAACLQNGAMCLSVHSAELQQVPEVVEGEFVFLVEFSEQDGSLFELGPCCGADPEELPPTTAFTFRVRKSAEYLFQVLTPPVYGP